MTRPTDADDAQPRETAAVAVAILRYVGTHPHAGDTLVGISDWWLAQPCDGASEATVAQALKQLVERGQLSARPGVDGKLVYRAQASGAEAGNGPAAQPGRPAP